MLTQASQLLQTFSFPSPSNATEGDLLASHEKFQRYYIDRTLAVVRVALVIGIFLVTAVCALDLVLMPSAFAREAIPFRIMVMLLPLNGALAATFLIKERLWIPYITASAAVLICVASLYVFAMAAEHGVQLVMWTGIYVTFNIYLVLGLNLRQSMAAGWPVFLLYVAVGVISGAPTLTIAYGSLYLAFSNLVGTYASHLLERNAREIFNNKRELERLARTDGLTGLFNRRAFDEHLPQVWKQARRDEKNVAIVLADIDHFKLFNDCYGHPVGDDCIKIISNVLEASAKRPLDLVARYGGEEFAIVLYDPSVSFLESFASRLCYRVVDQEIDHKASAVSPSVTISIGAAITQASGNVSPEQLLRRADDALYEAKNLGRNQAVIYKTAWGEQTGPLRAAVLL
jgi:diguanylate cyclase (GGDEF)-like protein